MENLTILFYLLKKLSYSTWILLKVSSLIVIFKDIFYNINIVNNRILANISFENKLYCHYMKIPVKYVVFKELTVLITYNSDDPKRILRC